MVTTEYATRRPPPPSGAAVFVHHHVIPGAINLASAIERSLSLVAGVTRSHPIAAGIVATTIGYAIAQAHRRAIKRRA